ncbi:sensor histidine kinase [Desulfotruncus arcticus]|uniref:sensor histidine kinase n=1 Tax=Desulfotruncus arcticus TaxID=341036 RepID=UPI00307E3BFD
MITTSVHAIKTKADEKNITLNIKFNRNIETCFDLKWTEEAMINILDNAVKYTPTGGTISISTTGYELFTRINIEDNGIGIEKGEVNRIFQRFYRSPKVSRYEGVGIGLYLAREIITAGGGYIKVASEPGKGSVFWVFLPNSKEKT